MIVKFSNGLSFSDHIFRSSVLTVLNFQFIYNLKFLKSFSKKMSNQMNNVLLDDQEATTTDTKGTFLKYQLKIHHLNELNKKVYLENDQLKLKVKKLEDEKKTFLNTKLGQSSIFANLSKQIQQQRQKNQELSKKNEQLLATILVNEQLNIELKKQSKFYVKRYEQKILDLRQNLQLKEVQIQQIEDKYSKFKALHLPMSVKNANRYTSEVLKYEALIQQLIQDRNKDKFKSIQEVGNALSKLDPNSQKTKQVKSTKIIPSKYATTDVRPNLNNLMTEADDMGSLVNEKLDVMFLRVNLELRQLKVKYKKSQTQIQELRSKDKVMKDGYMTLTKEMEKIKIENCQLKIQLEHLDKKIKTSHELSKIKSAGNIRKVFFKDSNAESKLSSEVSIEANISEVKTNLKATLASQTKLDTLTGNKSHNFDQRIQNIEGLLSHDSDPDFKGLDKKIDQQKLQKQEDDQDLSVCQQNQGDFSVSFDASGFLAPQKSLHEVSEHILSGLVDNKKIF